MPKEVAKQLRFLLVSWLMAVTLEFLWIDKELRTLVGLDGIAEISLARIFFLMAAVIVLLNVLPKKWITRRICKWMMVCSFALYATSAVINSFTWPFLFACAAVLFGLVVYAVSGWNRGTPAPVPQGKESPVYPILAGVAALVFFGIVSTWTVTRVLSFYSPTYDFGIFAQMFHNMKELGLPMTTLERDGWLSHFAVHVSPIYYLMLPFYFIVPRPETLQVLQAAVLASAVIPLWKIGKHHGLSPMMRLLTCILLLLFPAYAGGTSYDLHENCFLTPLLLWLFYGIDRKDLPKTVLFAFLTLMVKEDAPVYAAVIALYLLVRSIRQKEKWGIYAGSAVLIQSVAWFVFATAYLAKSGDGVMTFRYDNFMYDGSDSLFTVILSVVICPLKAVFESVDVEKLEYIGLTMLPLLCMPLLTRRFDRLLLLIPYVLINLMSDYVYQHDIMFQYSFGSTAFLFYMFAVNLADLDRERTKLAVLAVALCVSFGCFNESILVNVNSTVENYGKYKAYYDTQRELLLTVPEDVSVAATTYYTAYLSNRTTLYDIYYADTEHVLSCEYVVIKVSDPYSFKKYNKTGQDGKDNFVKLLLENGYVMLDSSNSATEIYRKAQ